ncbi:MAG: exonuclease domain-containing protein, partial [Eubacteriales bacterium]|nr:exonuclease domain-containing protein [Eubacteriales bacterium]
EQPAEAPAAKSFSLNSAVQKDSSLKTLNRFNRVIAINIETPNNEHDSICNIGITVGDTEKCLSTNVTVNPEEAIDDVPDGMTEEEILNSPTLKELWPGMSKLLAGSLVIAHNASYDLTILKKALKAYGLEVPEFYQACTYRMSRKFHPEFDSYKLGSICETYQIPLDVKNAVSHSDACFDIFCRLVDEGNPVFEEAKLFSLD